MNYDKIINELGEFAKTRAIFYKYFSCFYQMGLEIGGFVMYNKNV